MEVVRFMKDPVLQAGRRRGHGTVQGQGGSALTQLREGAGGGLHPRLDCVAPAGPEQPTSAARCRHNHT
jgi:hypothetical protein